MENKFKHNVNVSCEVALQLEDDLDDGIIPQSQAYKAIIKYIPQDFLDNFLGWFTHEVIERYVNKMEKKQ